MNFCVTAHRVRRAEDGPLDGSSIRGHEGFEPGAPTRAAAEVAQSLRETFDALIVGTTAGDPADPRDPHGTVERGLDLAFKPRLGTCVVSAGDRTVAAGLVEASLQLHCGAQTVGLILLDWRSPLELAVGFVLSANAGTPVTRPKLERALPTACDLAQQHSMAGALRLAQALEDSLAGAPVMLDRCAVDGIAWHVVVAPAES